MSFEWQIHSVHFNTLLTMFCSGFVETVDLNKESPDTGFVSSLTFPLELFIITRPVYLVPAVYEALC